MQSASVKKYFTRNFEDDLGLLPKWVKDIINKSSASSSKPKEKYAQLYRIFSHDGNKVKDEQLV